MLGYEHLCPGLKTLARGSDLDPYLAFDILGEPDIPSIPSLLSPPRSPAVLSRRSTQYTQHSQYTQRAQRIQLIQLARLAQQLWRVRHGQPASIVD